MTLLRIEMKKIKEGDGLYYISEDGRVFHRKGRLKVLKTWKEGRRDLVYLFDGNGKRTKKSISALVKKYWTAPIKN